MAENTYDLKLLLGEKEYVAGVRAALESKVKKGLFKKDKEIVELLNAFNAGSATLDQAQRILAELVLQLQDKIPQMSLQTIGSFSVLRGASQALAWVVKSIMEEQEKKPDADAQEITARVLALAIRR